MPRAIPLEHVLAPGSYPCQWVFELQGTEYRLDGHLDLEGLRGPTGTAFGGVPLEHDEAKPGTIATSFPQEFKITRARAELRNGMTAHVVDCVIETWFMSQARLWGRYALVGAQDDLGQALIAEARIQVSDLDRITAFYPIARTHPLTKEDPEWRIEPAPELWTKWSSESADLELGFYSLAKVRDPYAASIAFSPVAILRPENPLTLDALMSDWVEPLRDIAALSMSRDSIATLVLVEIASDGDQGRRPRLQVYGSALTQAPFAAASVSARENRPAVTFGPAAMSLLVSLEAWQAFSSEQHPLFETYASVQGLRDDHPRSRFLLLIQALEGLFGYEKKAERETKLEEHKAARAEAFAEIDRFTEFSPTSRKWIKKSISGRPFDSLETALTWCATSLSEACESQLKSTVLLDAMISDGTATSWADGIRVIRNDLAHGNRSYSAPQLHQINDVVERLVRGHVMRLLGATPAQTEVLFSRDFG